MRRRRSLWLAGGWWRGAPPTPGSDGVGIRCPEGISRRCDIPSGEGVVVASPPGVAPAPRLQPPANHRERLRRTHTRSARSLPIRTFDAPSSPRSSSPIPRPPFHVPRPPSLVPSFLVPRPPFHVPRPPSLVPRPPSLLTRPSSLVPHPTSLVPLNSSPVPRPSSLIPRPSYLVPRPSSLVPRTSSLARMRIFF